MTHPIPENSYEQSIVDNVREFGWHCTSVGGGEEAPPFTYSIGLWESFDHPELVVIGLDTNLAHSVLSKVARAVEVGEAFDLSQPTDRLLDNYSCVFLAVPPEQYADLILSACWYYRNEEIPVYQVIWPSLEGLFPWHPDASDEVRLSQPVLGKYTGDQ